MERIDPSRVAEAASIVEDVGDFLEVSRAEIWVLKEEERIMSDYV